MSDYADIDEVVRGAMAAWRPPPRLTLSQWADEHFFLSAESAAEPGRWRTIPYQRGWMDEMTRAGTEMISVMKSARVGYTKSVNAAIGYFIDHAPCPIMVVQPTVDDAKGYSKEEIAPMLRDCPRLARIVFEDAEEVGPRDGGNTILHKKFPGGVLSMVGANSGTGFRRVSRKVVIFDEVDGYPQSAGSDGDQIKLGMMRAQYYWDRKIIAGSTPLIAGLSRIELLFEQGDQRRYFVPCPQCGHMAPFVFSGEHGHAMTWPEGRPEAAFFTCQKNGCVIEHKHKRSMVEAGEWRAAKPFAGHASFHIWAAYGYAANAEWGRIATEFVEAKGNPLKLKTFVNTVLGETWKEQGDAPDWEKLYSRRETYEIGTVPTSLLAITAGVDVQRDRFVYEVVGWGTGKESWSIDAGVIPADTAKEADWRRLSELLARTYLAPDGSERPITMLAVDTGFNTNQAYSWARRFPRNRVIAVKGSATVRTLISSPSALDTTMAGKRQRRGHWVWHVGVDVAKAELYGWLRLTAPGPGYCHFPQYGEDFFKQLTAEHLVSSTDARGYLKHEWQLQPGRENHWLDARVYARAAAALLGLDRMRAATPPAPPPPPPLASASAPPPTPRRPSRRGAGGGDRFMIRGRGWLKR